MKSISEVVCCVVDAGCFLSVAQMMGKVCREAYYYSPFEGEYLNMHECCIGEGLENVRRIDDYMEPEFYDSVDLWMFPDIGYGGLQKFLRREGKAVWGSMGASDLELYRTHFITVIEGLGLPVVPSVTCQGLDELNEHLKSVKDKWVKVNRYRGNMETWRHQDYEHSQRELERLAMEFGGYKNRVVFVVQDTIKGEDDSPVIEVGYDGWTVDGEFPAFSFQGVEAKNEAYLGSLLAYDDLPEEVKSVNESMSPILKEYGYRNFFATEIRVKDGVPYFIDPTMRMAGQTMEHLLLTCTNLPEVIWRGAQGELIVPEFSHDFAAESTLHYKSNGEGWKVLRVPEKVKDKVMIYRACSDGEAYHFPPGCNDEVGVVIGQGDSIESSIDDLKDNFAALSEESVSINEHSFVQLLEEIAEGEQQGVEFSDQQVPSPESAL